MWMIYGANGYSGHLIARMAVDQGMKPIIAGRNVEQLTKISTELSLEKRIFSLDDVDKIVENIQDIDVVLHCAGPFSRTASPMVEACLKSKTHYLDITGEMGVFASVQQQDDAAKQQQIMLMPGVGFDVVPTDCMAAHLKKRLPTATHLALAFQGSGGISHGTATTMAENAGNGGCVRRDGKLVKVKSAWKTRSIDFGYGKTKAITIPWGDVFTAYYSTNIPNIEVYMAAPFAMRFGAKATRRLGFLLSSSPVQNYLKKRIKAQPAGPSDQERMRGRCLVWGEVKDGEKTLTSILEGPEGYTFTAIAALKIVQKVLEGEIKAGFQTPSLVYGSSLVESCEGVVLKDV
ncbi:saccharopine dehydrogenase family protein [Candidatus Uabimicrobium amorphum]|uniref:Saccharopine dehydrogenase n=1 Tax=Uabimicrobium amorphum TaxID=2596890 RepID=A0A5S9IKH8_UABAM|nr:saccharopine dehydrogenase NADP-binding domain-containing protein [Candidatus Uabimicrobium amorphum]BBM83116.1 saccharopine dehydrogenase [Candidatus Uabimicrobium amorphum]